MKLLSWNVNGLRAAERKGFLDVLRTTDADVVLLQEIRSNAAQLSEALLRPRGWHVELAPAERPGYAGVAIYSRRRPDAVAAGIGVPSFDREGRVLMARFGRLSLLSAYFPNSGRDLSRIHFKLKFMGAMLRHLDALRAAGQHVVVAGDFNVAHAEIDIARPKQNAEASGFTLRERRWVDRYLKSGWVDSFRHLNPDARDRYTWWLQTMDARARNVGWRIDYHFVDRALLPRVREATIQHEVMGSDHCPVGLVIAS
jgi:exodeoxyribonuclease-3